MPCFMPDRVMRALPGRLWQRVLACLFAGVFIMCFARFQLLRMALGRRRSGLTPSSTTRSRSSHFLWPGDPQSAPLDKSRGRLTILGKMGTTGHQNHGSVGLAACWPATTCTGYNTNNTGKLFLDTGIAMAEASWQPPARTPPSALDNSWGLDWSIWGNEAAALDRWYVHTYWRYLVPAGDINGSPCSRVVKAVCQSVW